ncbi:histidine phosphatase family protein [Sphingomonas mollis]
MTTPVAVHLMRHGTPTLTGRLLGRTDCPVTDDGLTACRTAAARLDVEAIHTSDLIRAHACANAAATALTVPVHVDPRWRELDFGEWDGRAPADCDSEALASFWADPDACPPPGGERWSALLARVTEALAQIDRPTLVMTHGGAMRAALAVIGGLDTRQIWAFDLPYACILSLNLWPGTGGQIIGLSR